MEELLYESIQIRWFIWVAVGLFWFAHYVFVPFLSPYLAAMGISASVVGIVIGAYGFPSLSAASPLA